MSNLHNCIVVTVSLRPSPVSQEKTRHGAFSNLIRPRENVVRYGAPMAVATEAPASELARQYAKFVTASVDSANDARKAALEER